MRIMMQNVCSLAATRDQQIVAYLYQEGPLDERIGFERHLAACALCRAEVDALRGVRAELGQWPSPDVDFSVTMPEMAGAAVVPAPRWQFPVWAQAAAAVLCVGVGAGAANLHVNYSSGQGLTVRTGWQHQEPAAVAAVPTPVATAAPAVERPWRADLAALEQRLRAEQQAQPVAASVSPAALDEAALRRVRALLEDSERRQQRDVALRFAEMAREVESQRQSDLARIDRSLGLVQSRTGMEVMRTQQQMNSLAQRVSQRQ
jgi:anti-sigma factor RsiW